MQKPPLSHQRHPEVAIRGWHGQAFSCSRAGVSLSLVLLIFLAAPHVRAAPATSAASPPPAAATMPESPLELALLVAGQPDPLARRQAARQMLQINSAESIKALLALFDSRNNEAAKISVCEAIAETRSRQPAFIPPLLQLLEDADPAVRKAAATALAGYQDATVVERLRAFNERQEIAFLIDSHSALMKALYERTPETDRPVLLQAWLNQSLSPVERMTAIDIVHLSLRKGTIPDTSVLEQIRTMLRDPQAAIRQKAILVLRDRGLQEDASRIQQTLATEQTPAVREAAYSALGLLGDAATIPQAIKGLSDPSDSVAAEAATALGRLAEAQPNGTRDTSSPAAAALLQRASRPIENPKLRERIVDAMSRVGDVKFLPMLVKCAGVGETVPAVRQAALRGIGQIGDRSQMAVALDRLNDTDAGVREAAAEAVGRLGSQLDHLRALKDRLNPKVEPSLGVQNRAWEAYTLIFTALRPAEQKTVLETWSGADSGTVSRRIDLLAALEKQASSSKSDPAQLAGIREQLGDALIAASRPAEAAAVLARAIESSPGSAADQSRVTLKLVDTYLMTPTWEKAITAAASLESPALRDKAAEHLLQFAEAGARTDASMALAFLDRIRESVPDQFGAPWAERFDAVRKALPVGTRPATTPTGT